MRVKGRSLNIVHGAILVRPFACKEAASGWGAQGDRCESFGEIRRLIFECLKIWQFGGVVRIVQCVPAPLVGQKQNDIFLLHTNRISRSSLAERLEIMDFGLANTHVWPGFCCGAGPE